MPELGPLLAERRVDLEPRGVDDRLVLVRVQGADAVHDRAAWLDALGGRTEERRLKLRERRRAPAQVWAPCEDAEARARRVDERAVESFELRRKGGRVRAHDANVCRPE